MAAASEAKILNEIGEDFLCCTICLEQFKSPKVLPCLHTFCEQCLVTLVEKTGSLKCPECRQQCQLPDGGVPEIKSNFFMTNLIDIFGQLLAAKTGSSESCVCEGCHDNTATTRCVDCRQYLCDGCTKVHSNLAATQTHKLMAIDEYKTMIQSRGLAALQTVEYCSVHTKNELEFYCETCRVPVCTNCTIVKHRIPEHVHTDMKDAADGCRRDLKAMADKLKAKEQEVEKNKSLAKRIHRDLGEQCKKEVKEVRMAADEIINKVKREEQRLVDELNKAYEMKMEGAAGDIDELELKHGNIKSAYGYVDTLMHHGSATHLLSTKADAEHRISQLISMETKPQGVHEKIDFVPKEKFNEHGIVGKLVYDVHADMCTIENIPKQLLKGDSSDLLITTRDSTGKKVIPAQGIKASVRKPDATQEDVKVSDNGDGTHCVRVNVVIPVIRGLVKTIGSKGSGEGQYDRPWSVVINKNRDIVTADANNNRLQVTTIDGRVKKTIKPKQLENTFRPFDISISNDNIYHTVNRNTKQVAVTDENGHIIRCFGQNELKDPYGISISPVNGNVYVTDKGEHCVRIYTQCGKYIRSFGSEGKGQGEFNWPYHVAVGSNGMVFVADSYNHRIQVFNADDQHLYSFGCQSDGNGELNVSTGIATDDRHVYVSSSVSNCILKFEISGRFVNRIDSDEDGLDCPIGITLTDDVPCRVVVADKNNNCIKVFVQ